MERVYKEDEIFEQENYTLHQLPVGDYEECSFTNCDFNNSTLSDIRFTDCVFTNCNLGMATINKTGFRNVRFEACKLIGLHFDRCSPMLFEVFFHKCILNLCSFFNVKMKHTVFKDCNLQETDFSETDLSGAVFDGSDLSGAVFFNSILDKADFRTAEQFSINPQKNRMKKAKFSVPGLAGLLNQFDLDISP